MQPNVQRHRFSGTSKNISTWEIKMKNRTKRSAFFVLAASTVVLAGCGGSGSGSEEVGTTGFLSLGVSDGPIHSAKKVCIEFTEIELKGSGPSTLVTLESPEKVNLLDFQGDEAMPILMNHELEAGDYQWMRLGIEADKGGIGGTGDSDPDLCDGEASYIVMDDGMVHNLYVPSSSNNGLKLVGGFTVAVNDTTYLTAEFDVAKSITAPPGLDPDVVMRPTIRLVNNVEVGTLTGLVATELATAAECAPSVYVFNDGVTPNLIGPDDSESTETDPNDPVATAMVNEHTNDDDSVEWNYTVGFLLAGDYEAAFTCGDENFEPAEGKPAPIMVNEVTTVSFEVPAPE
jgi:hypothetical protein